MGDFLNVREMPVEGCHSSAQEPDATTDSELQVHSMCLSSKVFCTFFRHTITPNGSELSHRVWISFFLFYFLGLSFQNVLGSHCIVSMYVYMILLRNTKGRNSWNFIARVISQWFWCKYFAHTFMLNSKCSKKIFRLPILYIKHSCLLTSSCQCSVCMLIRKEGKCDNSTLYFWWSLKHFDIYLMHARAHMCRDWRITQRGLTLPYLREEQWH
jgi:hypothetical protein